MPIRIYLAVLELEMVYIRFCQWKHLQLLNIYCHLFQAINPLELAMEALKEIQTQFYRDFPPHPQEKVYGFATPSTMKPTQWSCKS